MKLPTTAAFCLLSMSLPYSLRPQAKKGLHTQKSVRIFVAGFYNWYVPIALSDSSTPACNQALRIKRSSFSSKLAEALGEDADAQAKADGDLVGLDFDPFLNSQDPSDRYEVGKITPKGERYSVAIYGMISDKRSKTPDVIAVVERHNGHWQFVNFYYPTNGGNLLTVLRFLRKSRESPIAARPASAR